MRRPYAGDDSQKRDGNRGGGVLRLQNQTMNKIVEVAVRSSDSARSSGCIVHKRKKGCVMKKAKTQNKVEKKTIKELMKGRNEQMGFDDLMIKHQVMR